VADSRDRLRTVVVTGGAGYVGSVVSAHLLIAGYSVIVVDSLAGGGEALLPFARHPRFELVVADVRDAAVMRSVCGRADGLVHMAAVVGEAACTADVAATRAINVTATDVALSAAAAASMHRVVYIGTCSNYGVSDPDALADEEAPLNPLGLYAQTKVEAERTVARYARDLDCVILRLGTICGLSGRMRFDLLVNEMARAAVLGDPISVFGPQAWRPYLHIRDASRVVEWALARARGTAGETFNVVGENFQKKTLVGVVRRHYPRVSIDVTPRMPDARDYRVSDARIRRNGFETLFTVETAFLEVAAAVQSGVFINPRSPAHVAAPPVPQLSRTD